MIDRPWTISPPLLLSFFFLFPFLRGKRKEKKREEEREERGKKERERRGKEKREREEKKRRKISDSQGWI